MSHFFLVFREWPWRFILGFLLGWLLFSMFHFLHRNIAPSYGVDLIATFFLFYSCWVQSDLLKNSKVSTCSSMAYRLCQIQVCIIYAYSGLGKFGGTHWWQGVAIWDVLANFQLARWDFGWLSSFPLLIIFMTYLTLLWEVYFPVLVWIKPMKKSVLAFGFLLHLGIAVLISIPYFSAIMVATYILFMDTQDLRLFHRSKLARIFKLA